MAKIWRNQRSFVGPRRGGAAAVILVLCCSFASADDGNAVPPAQVPQIADFSTLTPTPAAQAKRPPSSAELRSWVRQLDDDDPAIREAAMSDLMGLNAGDLAALRGAAMAQRPLSPGQLAGLRDVVAQVFLAAQQSQPDMSQGYPCAFVGMLWGNDDGKCDDGVVVPKRFPGLAAYRLLRTGDVILKLTDHPNIPMHAPSDFIGLVSLLHPGGTLRLRVLRYGHVIDVSLDLACRPRELSPARAGYNIEYWLETRSRQAGDYWNSQFAGLDAVPDASAHKKP